MKEDSEFKHSSFNTSSESVSRMKSTIIKTAVFHLLIFSLSFLLNGCSILNGDVAMTYQFESVATNTADEKNDLFAM